MNAPVKIPKFTDERPDYFWYADNSTEKADIAARVTQELGALRPAASAIRVFDAGIGDGTVLTHVMAAAHQRFPDRPLYVTGKEFSGEDVVAALEKMPRRFEEHPATALILTNMSFATAPWLTPAPDKAQDVVWQDVALEGETARGFKNQINALETRLLENWQTVVHPKTGHLVPARPTVMVIHRKDQGFLRENLIPQKNDPEAGHDLVIASQAYRAQASLDSKVRHVIAPLARALRPGGRLIGIHASGGDFASEVAGALWPNDNFFPHSGHAVTEAAQRELAMDGRAYSFSVDATPLRSHLHPLPTSGADFTGTAPLVNRAWKAAAYVAQVPCAQIQQAVRTGAHLNATRNVLTRHQGKIAFHNTVYGIARAPGTNKPGF